MLFASLAGASGYTIENACRFNLADTAFTGAASPTPTSERIFTFSFWVKRTKLGTRMTIWSNERDDGAGSYATLEFGANDTIRWKAENTSGYLILDRVTNAVFRDTSSWYHIVVVVDSNQTDATCADIYVNGVVQTYSATTNFPSAQDMALPSTAQPFEIGRLFNATYYLDAYLANFYFIDGQKLAPSSFGETSETTGEWVPTEYSGSFGNAGLFLEFKVATGTDDGAGTDTSGNGNHLTDSGLATDDKTVDTPTDNHATLNPLAEGNNSSNLVTYTDGNTIATQPGSHGCMVYGSIGVSSGKWVWEVDVLVANAGYVAINGIGIASVTSKVMSNHADTPWNSTYANGYCYKLDGDKNVLGTDSSYGATYNASNLIRVELNLDDDEVTFFKDNASQGAISISSGLTWFPAWYQYLAGDSVQFKFKDLTNTPTSGFLTLNTANLPAPAIADPDDHFFSKVVTHGGTSTTTPCTFNLDTYEWLCIIKNLDNIEKWYWIDSIRGVTQILSSDATTVEDADSNVLAVSAATFTLGSTLLTDDYLVEFHRAGLASATDTNDVGRINTTATSVNTTSGFSMSTYTGDGSAATIGHGLGAIPDMIICKERTNDVGGWFVYHSALADPETEYLFLDTNVAPVTDTTVWNAGASHVVSTTLFSIGNHDDIGESSGTYISYAWAGVEGYSSFGSFSGNNNADGPMINMGMCPTSFFSKQINTTEQWFVYSRKNADVTDANPVDHQYYYDGTDAQSANGKDLDFLSNGIKSREAGGGVNAASGTFVYAAWGGSPFKTGNAK